MTSPHYRHGHPRHGGGHRIRRRGDHIFEPHSHVSHDRGRRAGTGTIWRAPAGGGAAEQLGVSMPGYIKNPQISPDGRSLFFWTNHNGQDEIWALEHFLSSSTTDRR